MLVFDPQTCVFKDLTLHHGEDRSQVAVVVRSHEDRSRAARSLEEEGSRRVHEEALSSCRGHPWPYPGGLCAWGQPVK